MRDRSRADPDALRQDAGAESVADCLVCNRALKDRQTS